MTTAIIPRQQTAVELETVGIDYSGARDDAHLIQLYLDLGTRAASTRATYTFEIARFQQLVPKTLAAVTLDDLRFFIATLRDRGLSEVSTSRALTVIRALFRFGQETGYLRFNVAKALRVRGRQAAPRNEFLTPGESERLLEAARKRGLRSLTMIGLLIGTGIRRAELRTSSWGDLFDDGAGRVGLRVLGKGDKVRVVKIRDDLWAVLRAFRRQLGKPEGFDPEDKTPLAMNRMAERISDRGIHREVVACGKAAGITKHCHPHLCRHSHATLSLQAGATIIQVQEALGHSSVATTGGYLHAARGLESTAADFLPFSI